MITENPPRTGLEKELRLRGISYESLAGEVGVRIQTVGSWARGRTTPDAEMRKKVSKILGIDIYTLFFQHEDDPNFLTPPE